MAVADRDTAVAVADQDTAVAVADQDTAAAVADQDTAVAVSDLVLRREAIEWATKSKDSSFIANLVDTLPGAVADEQVRLYQASKCAAVVPHAPQAIVVYPHLLKSRQEAARLFDTELRNAGWAPGTRLPRASARKFVGWCGQNARPWKLWAARPKRCDGGIVISNRWVMTSQAAVAAARST